MQWSTIYFRWLLLSSHFLLTLEFSSLPWRRASSLKQKSMHLDIYFENRPFFAHGVHAKRLGFISSMHAEGWNYSIPSADEEQTKWRERKSIYACTLLGLHGWVCVCVCAQSTCRESRNLLEISVIIINIYIDTSYSSSSLDLALSFFPCFVIKLCLVLV